LQEPEVRLRTKIVSAVGALITLGTSVLMIMLSHESACPPAPPLAAGVESMRAITHRCYGSPGAVLALETIAKPTPGDGELLIKVHAASVNPVEWHMVTGKPYFMRMSTGFGAPAYVRVGYDMAGTIEAIGTNVTRFKVGDEVFGGGNGSLGEYVIVKERNGDIARKPAQVTFDEAAGILIAAGTALEGLREYGRIEPGQKVLINGASGGVGTYAVQLAKVFGAEVTAVCSTRNVELVRSLGADHVVDYTKENFTDRKEQYDLIIDNVGNHPFLDLRRVVKPEGAIVTISGPKTNNFFGPITRVVRMKVLEPFMSQRLVFFIADIDAPDLEFMAGLMRDGKLKSVIDRRYPLEQAGAAIDYIGTSRARGKVIVTLD
jgi:NADPH:quinone reductase-like Zn-dependent oxidoreductase